MAKKSNQKLKLLYLARIFLEHTDENNGITRKEIQALLAMHGISVERKSVYTDIEELKHFGFDITTSKENGNLYYYLASREFETAELKLLVDAVQSAKFISEKKSNELIKKLEGLVSKHEATKLQRQVYVQGRLKMVNESVYYNVDKIHTAIGKNVKVKFKYYQWNINKEKELRRNGEYYCINPWALIWEDEYYYMVGYDDVENKVKHYRVDKMLYLEVIDFKREGNSLMINFDSATYSKKIFGMFNGEEKFVEMVFENKLAGVVIDRFGLEVPIIKKDENHFKTTVKVAVSGQFFGWIMSLGEGVEIIGPSEVVDRMSEEVERLYRTYIK